MKAKIQHNKAGPEIQAVVLENGALVLKTSVPVLTDRGYNHMVLHETLTLTTGSFDYWIESGRGTPVYEGQTVILEF